MDPDGARVLIVDDDRDSCEGLRALFQAWGYRVAIALGGKEGIARALADQPAIVVLDVSLADVDGLEVARTLRAAFASTGILIIALTGWAGREQQAREAGCDVYLLKPADTDVLKHLLESGTQPLTKTSPGDIGHDGVSECIRQR